jgi:hypothetical protein
MPVSISHIYNSNDSQINKFGMGNGWKTNYNQTITSSGGGAYVWEDGDGTRHEFVTTNGVTSDVDGLHLSLTVTETGYLLTDGYGNVSEFTGSKLTKMTTTRSANADKGKHTVTITHDSDTGFISQITDGAGRKYVFTYNQSNLLNKIAYMGTGSAELAYVTYAYTSVVTDDGTKYNLTKVTDRDGFYTAYTYSGHLLSAAQDVSVVTNVDGDPQVTVEYCATYSYNEDTDGNPTLPIKEVKKHISTTLEDSVLEAKLQALELLVRGYTHNNFQKRSVRCMIDIME